MAAMAGLSVLLETAATAAAQQKQPPQLSHGHAAAAGTTTAAAARVISKATVLSAATTKTTKNAASTSTDSSSTRARSARPQSPPAARCESSFLQRCFLCHRELADGKDIYIYRGDRAFCSEECRCRHILLDESDDGSGAMNCARDAAAGRRRRQSAAGGFAF
ncbi:hypothetical protein ACP70R_008569 [Stipagrostis hirtigluma subsp. patula]